jgi:hypothetical protein
MTASKRGKLHQQFEPWMIDKLKEHLALGGSFNSFCGAANITMENWRAWVKASPELTQINIAYKTKIQEKRKYKVGGL